jgi:hypothetical protein
VTESMTESIDLLLSKQAKPESLSLLACLA